MLLNLSMGGYRNNQDENQDIIASVPKPIHSTFIGEVNSAN